MLSPRRLRATSVLESVRVSCLSPPFQISDRLEIGGEDRNRTYLDPQNGPTTVLKTARATRHPSLSEMRRSMESSTVSAASHAAEDYTGDRETQAKRRRRFGPDENGRWILKLDLKSPAVFQSRRATRDQFTQICDPVWVTPPKRRWSAPGSAPPRQRARQSLSGVVGSRWARL